MLRVSFLTHVCRLFVCFVCLEFIVPIKNFSLIWRPYHCQWTVVNFDLCSAPTTEQWGFFNVPHPLRHGPTVYNGHLWGPVTLTPVAKRLAVDMSLSVFTTDRTTFSRMPGLSSMNLYVSWHKTNLLIAKMLNCLCKYYNTWLSHYRTTLIKVHVFIRIAAFTKIQTEDTSKSGMDHTYRIYM